MSKPNDSIVINTTIWYDGMLTIQEVPHLDITSDSTGDRIQQEIRYFLFINPKTPLYAYYRSFSDTAQKVEASRSTNLFAKYGGWNLYSHEKFDYEKSQQLTDTMINGKSYRRFKFQKTNSGKINDFILYGSCEQKGIPIGYLSGFVDLIGCPITGMDTFYEGKLVGTTKLNHVSNFLTAKEQTIFQLWKSGAIKKKSKN